MATGPQHNWGRYTGYVLMFLLIHLAARSTLGSIPTGWTILSGGVFGLAIGIPIGQAEYYTDGYEIMTLICPAFTCCLGLGLSAIAVWWN